MKPGWLFIAVPVLFGWHAPAAQLPKVKLERVLTKKGYQHAFFLPDGKTLLMVTRVRLDLMELQSGRILRSRVVVPERATGPNAYVYAALSPNGKLIATIERPDNVILTSEPHLLALRDMTTLEVVRQLEAAGAPKYGAEIAFVDDEHVISNFNGSLRVWHVSGKLVAELIPPELSLTRRQPSKISVSPNGRWISVWYYDLARGKLVVWDRHTGHARIVQGNHKFGCAMAFSPDSKLFAHTPLKPGGRSSEISVEIINLDDWVVKRRIDNPDATDSVRLRFSTDNNSIAVGDSRFYIFSIITGEKIFSAQLPDWREDWTPVKDLLFRHYCSDIKFALDGTHLLTCHFGDVMIWRVHRLLKIGANCTPTPGRAVSRSEIAGHVGT